MYGVGPPAPAQKSTKVYFLRLEGPRTDWRVWATREAGDVGWRKGAWSFQISVKQAWTERRREGGNQDWSSISKRRRGGMGRGRVMVWVLIQECRGRLMACSKPWFTLAWQRLNAPSRWTLGNAPLIELDGTNTT